MFVMVGGAKSIKRVESSDGPNVEAIQHRALKFDMS